RKRSHSREWLKQGLWRVLTTLSRALVLCGLRQFRADRDAGTEQSRADVVARPPVLACRAVALEAGLRVDDFHLNLVVAALPFDNRFRAVIRPENGRLDFEGLLEGLRVTGD